MPVSKFHELLQQFHKLMPRSGPRPDPGVVDTLNLIAPAPKFVYSRDVLDWLIEYESDYRSALATAVKAGHCELPHSPMVVEWNNVADQPDSRVFWWMAEIGNGLFNMRCALFTEIPYVSNRAFPARFDITGGIVFNYSDERIAHL